MKVDIAVEVVDNVVDAVVASWIKDNLEMIERIDGYLHPDDVKYNKKLVKDGKCNTLTLPHHNAQRLIVPPKIRKLTPIECERLQTVYDNYTEGVSDSQRYKMLGNGWTINVIAHIFSHIN